MADEATVFICGPDRSHKCDDDGPVVYFTRDGGVTQDRDEAEKVGCSGGSVTCSVCGMSSMERAMWEGL